LLDLGSLKAQHRFITDRGIAYRRQWLRDKIVLPPAKREHRYAEHSLASSGEFREVSEQGFERSLA
jgi:hypothetical protein